MVTRKIKIFDENSSNNFETKNTHDDDDDDNNTEKSNNNTPFITTNIQIIYNNFLVVNWSDADVVYCCSKCLAPNVLLDIAILCQKLKKNSYIILIDTEVLFQQYIEEMSWKCVLTYSSMITSSWGPCRVNVFQKQD
jgi:hypothetical protein